MDPRTKDRRKPARIGAFIGAGGERIQGAAMFEVAYGPQQDDGNQSNAGGDATSRTTLPRADFFVDQSEEGRRN